MYVHKRQKNYISLEDNLMKFVPNSNVLFMQILWYKWCNISKLKNIFWKII